jgi:hypothetical protein
MAKKTKKGNGEIPFTVTYATKTEKMQADREFWYEACEIMGVTLFSWTDRKHADVLNDTGNMWEFKGNLAEKLIELNRKIKELESK